ncbi:MAG: EFR1 family ferrodoxin [Lachnospiraceae bacterium]|nr:EFR1 family ferrodoxin [Lachnospiraceae bacterium]
MKGLGIYVFSGTGNTLKCAKALLDELESLGLSAALHEIGDGSEEAAEEEDLVLCYPVYGFNVPLPMLRFCRNLAEGSGRVWFLKTSGEPLRLNDNSSACLSRILCKKGRIVTGEFHYIMPYNIVFRHSDEAASLMWKTAKERIPAAAAAVAAELNPKSAGAEAETSAGTGTKTAAVPAVKKRAPVSSVIMSHICAIEHGFYPLNGRLYRVDADRCLNCMRCVKQCPTGNITYSEGKFRFGKNCAGCMRCAFNCPSDAIRIGILDFMRVNGPYDFGRDPEEASFGKYCRKAYKRYFEEQL